MPRDLQQRINALRSALRRVQPDDAWVKATRGTLLMQASNSLPTKPVRATAQVRQMFRHFIPSNIIQFFRGPVVATLSILTIALGGSVASVSAAELSLPGDFLYSLKLATEQARLALTPAVDEKLKLKLEFTSRRGDELKDVAKADGPGKPERVVQAAEILKRDLNTVKQQLNDVKAGSESKKVVEVARLVDQKTNQIVQSLQITKSELGAETKEKVTEAQAAASDTGVRAIEVLVEQHQESNDSISEGDVVQVMQDHSRTVADATVEGSLTVSSTSDVLTITTIATTTGALTEAVEQIKTASKQAFDAQKSVEQALAGTTPTSTDAFLEGSASSSGATTTPGASSTSSSTATGSSTSTTSPP